jgi:hypothetical protein
MVVDINIIIHAVQLSGFPALASLNILLDVDFKAYMERKPSEFFQAYGSVAREGKEDKEAAAIAAAEAAAAAAAAEAAAAAAASTLCYSLYWSVLIEEYTLYTEPYK